NRGQTAHFARPFSENQRLMLRNGCQTPVFPQPVRKKLLPLGLPPYRGLRVVVAPIEPVVLDHVEVLQAYGLRRTRDGAALEVPGATGGAVHEQAVRRIVRGAVEIGRGTHARNAGAKGAHGFTIRSDR